MQLDTLYLRRQTYGELKGKVTGEISFIDDAGRITINLSPEHVDRILFVCADALTAAAKEVATNLTAACIEAKATAVLGD